MRFWLPIKKDEKTADYHTRAVSVDGKAYRVSKDDKADGRPVVEIANDVPARTVQHLVTLGWIPADEKTANQVRAEAGIALDGQGKPKVDETLRKAIEGK